MSGSKPQDSGVEWLLGGTPCPAGRVSVVGAGFDPCRDAEAWDCDLVIAVSTAALRLREDQYTFCASMDRPFVNENRHRLGNIIYGCPQQVFTGPVPRPGFMTKVMRVFPPVIECDKPHEGGVKPHEGGVKGGVKGGVAGVTWSSIFVVLQVLDVLAGVQKVEFVGFDMPDLFTRRVCNAWHKPGAVVYRSWWA